MYEWVKNPRFVPLPDAGEEALIAIPKGDTMARLDVPHRVFGALIRDVDALAGDEAQKEVEAPRKQVKKMEITQHAKYTVSRTAPKYSASYPPYRYLSPGRELCYQNKKMISNKINYRLTLYV